MQTIRATLFFEESEKQQIIDAYCDGNTIRSPENLLINLVHFSTNYRRGIGHVFNITGNCDDTSLNLQLVHKPEVQFRVEIEYYEDGNWLYHVSLLHERLMSGYYSAHVTAIVDYVYGGTFTKFDNWEYF